jgi:thiosulfate reductase cytochrome b subunit
LNCPYNESKFIFKENAMSEQSNVPMMSGAPEPIYQVWIKALTRPNEQTYAELAVSPQAKAGTAYMWYFVAALVSFLLSSLVQGAQMSQIMQQFGADASQFETGGIGSNLITAICVAIIQWIAKMFGGRGTTEQLAYVLSAVLSPFLVVSGVLSLLGAIPYVGLCFSGISILAGIYALVLEVMAVKGVNQFGWGAAIGSLFIPVLAIAFLCACLAAVMMMAMGPMIGEIFSGINQSLQYGP